MNPQLLQHAQHQGAPPNTSRDRKSAGLLNSFALLLACLPLCACASNTPVSIPLDHPANPTAPQAAFHPPPNVRTNAPPTGPSTDTEKHNHHPKEGQ